MCKGMCTAVRALLTLLVIIEFWTDCPPFMAEAEILISMPFEPNKILLMIYTHSRNHSILVVLLLKV